MTDPAIPTAKLPRTYSVCAKHSHTNEKKIALGTPVVDFMDLEVGRKVHVREREDGPGVIVEPVPEEERPRR